MNGKGELIWRLVLLCFLGTAAQPSLAGVGLMRYRSSTKWMRAQQPWGNSEDPSWPQWRYYSLAINDLDCAPCFQVAALRTPGRAHFFMYTLVIVVFTTQFGAGTIERASAMNISSVPGFQTLALCESAASNVGFASLKVAGVKSTTLCVQTKK